MSARVSQQMLVVAYTTSPEARVSAVALEVIRPVANAPVANTKGVQVIVVAS